MGNKNIPKKKKMSELRSSVRAVLITSVSLCLVYAVVKILHILIWKPTRIQKLLNSQGFKGPGYRFPLGNIREFIRMRDEALSKPMASISHELAPRIMPQIHFWTKKYGRNLMFWAGPVAHLVLTEPEMIRQALFNKDGHFPKSEIHSEYLRKLMGNGVVTSEGAKWSKIKKLANFSFNGEKLKSTVPEMIDSAEMMLGRWKNKQGGEEMEVFEEFRMLTGEVISRTAFGSSFEEGRQIFDMLHRMSILIERNIFKIRLPIISKIFTSSDDKEAEMLEQVIRERVVEIVKRRQERVKMDGYGEDYLGLLMQACDEEDESSKISMEDLIDECKTLYVAGQDTTNVLLSWAVLLLALHQDWQQEVRNEVVTLFGRHKSPHVEGIAKLKTMGMIINETLRLYPPVATLTPRRVVDEKVRLGNLTLPAGVRLVVPIICIHNDPEIWGEDAHLFKPERFSQGVAKATNNNPAAFMPFGMGLRICAGFNFVTNEAKIALSMILQRYSFTLSPGYAHSPRIFNTIRPEKGVQVILRPLGLE